jgi:hypothetical protein
MIAHGTAPPPLSAAAEGSAPDWFSRGRIAREARAAAAAARAVEESKGEGEQSFRVRLVKWLVGGAAVGYVASLLFHTLLLAAFSLVALHLGTGGNSVSTELGISDEQGEEMLDTRAFEISSGLDGVEEPVATTVEPVPVEMPDVNLDIATAIAPEIKGAADGAGTDDKTAPGAGDDAVFELPKGGKAIHQGSFAAWTIPADPRPGQDYVIVVEVTLPNETDRYLRTDLTGQLIGTDGYKVKIPDGAEWNGLGWLRPRRTPLFRREGEKARIVFFIRGAHQALVRDTIQIRSNLLNEQQKLQIVF